MENPKHSSSWCQAQPGPVWFILCSSCLCEPSCQEWAQNSIREVRWTNWMAQICSLGQAARKWTASWWREGILFISCARQGWKGTPMAHPVPELRNMESSCLHFKSALAASKQPQILLVQKSLTEGWIYWRSCGSRKRGRRGETIFWNTGSCRKGFKTNCPQSTGKSTGLSITAQVCKIFISLYHTSFLSSARIFQAKFDHIGHLFHINGYPGPPSLTLNFQMEEKPDNVPIYGAGAVWPHMHHTVPGRSAGRGNPGFDHLGVSSHRRSVALLFLLD